MSGGPGPERPCPMRELPPHVVFWDFRISASTTPVPPSLVDELERAAHFADERGHVDEPTRALVAAALAVVRAARGLPEGDGDTQP